MFRQQRSSAGAPYKLALVAIVYGGLIVCSMNCVAHAQIRYELDGSFIDDFEDGDPRDNMPATWSLLATPEELYILNGDFITDRLRELPHQSLSYVELWNTMPTGFSIRTQARMLEIKDQGGMLPGLGPAVSISGRTCNEGLGLGHVCNEPELGGFPGMDWIYIDVRPNGEVHTAQSLEAEERVVETDIRPLEEDFNIQFDTFGQDISFWVWPIGEPRPEEPIIAYTSQDNPTLAPGGLMFGTVYAKAAFRSVHVSDTPIVELTGDFDFDFQVNAADIDALSPEIGLPTPRPWFDVNGDGEVTLADRRFWVESEAIGNTFFGDADLNGKVEFADFLVLSDNFGREGGWAEGNFDGLDSDGKGIVGFPDFLLLSRYFGNMREATLAESVPEPNASVVVLLPCSLCLRRRRRQRRRAFCMSEEKLNLRAKH